MLGQGCCSPRGGKGERAAFPPGWGVLGPLCQAGMLDGALPTSSFERGGGILSLCISFRGTSPPLGVL